MEKLTEFRLDVWTHSRMSDRMAKRLMNKVEEILDKWDYDEDEDTGIVNFKIYEV